MNKVQKYISSYRVVARRYGRNTEEVYDFPGGKAYSVSRVEGFSRYIIVEVKYNSSNRYWEVAGNGCIRTKASKEDLLEFLQECI